MPNRILALSLSVSLLSALTSASVDAAQVSAAANCRDWHECRQLALEAADRHDYEAFHDLAWRTLQTGPQRDPDLMYLLARAQCLSGRPHDALVMLRRLAEMGVATDAAVNQEFERTRALAGWAEVEALIERVRNPSVLDVAAATPAPATSVARSRNNRTPRTAPTPSTSRRSSVSPAPSVSPTPPVSATAAPAVSLEPSASSSALPSSAPATVPASVAPSPEPTARPTSATLPLLKPLRVEDAVRISTPRFAAGGLAYDAVSRRFVVGDLSGGRLMVVSEGSDHAVDLVRSDSAGFHQIRTIEIDWRRGDLWVVSATPNEEWAVHLLQLLSGRPLKAISASEGLGPMALVDLAVSPGGTVWVLDSIQSRLLVVRPRGTKLDASAQLKVDSASSLTATDEEGVVYVAHRTGIARVDTRTGRAASVTAPAGLELAGIERLRWHGKGLVAVQAGPDGSRRIVRFELNAARKAIAAATIIDASIPAAARAPFMTVSGDELSYLVAADTDAPLQSDRDAPQGGPGEFLVRRIRLR